MSVWGQGINSLLSADYPATTTNRAVVTAIGIPGLFVLFAGVKRWKTMQRGGACYIVLVMFARSLGCLIAARPSSTLSSFMLIIIITPPEQRAHKCTHIHTHTHTHIHLDRRQTDTQRAEDDENTSRQARPGLDYRISGGYGVSHRSDLI